MEPTRTSLIEGIDRPHRRTKGVAERFWSKVDREGPLPAVDGIGRCWLWTGHTTPQGYGSFGLGRRADGKTVAHRVAWSLIHGPIPPGMHIDHACGVRRCVNPDHLRLATRSENLQHRVSMHPGNKSGYRGVSWHRQARKWSAQVKIDGKKYHLGLFVDPAEAARVAAAKRAELFKFPEHPINEGEPRCRA